MPQPAIYHKWHALQLGLRDGESAEAYAQRKREIMQIQEDFRWSRYAGADADAADQRLGELMSTAVVRRRRSA